MTHDLLDARLIERIRHLRLSARTVVSGIPAGSHRSPRPGASVDFRQHKPWHAGDDLRYLDWRLLARTGRYFVRQYQRETNLRAALVLDASASMASQPGDDDKWGFATRLAAATAYLLLTARETTGLLSIGDTSKRCDPASQPGHLESVLSAIRGVTPGGTFDWTQLPDALRPLTTRRCLVVIFTDLLAPPSLIHSALSALRQGEHEVIAVRVTTRLDRELVARGTHQLRDSETGATMWALAPGDAARHREGYAAHERELAARCRAIGVSLVDCPVRAGVDGLADALRAVCLQGRT